jgi:phosphoglucomutase/phosphomannomutase
MTQSALNSGQTKQADLESALAALEVAQSAGKLSASAVENIQTWLMEPRYAEYAPLVLEHISACKWRELDNAFWTVIPFGTAGRRGRMYPIGTNAINDRTMGESAQGLADYVNEQMGSGEWGVGNANRRCVIAYDTRYRSRHFAELCAEIMVANGFGVIFFDGFRPTPELSFTVRDRQCACGIMISASHNPPSDNAIKAFWSSGGQLRAPHDDGVTRCVQKVSTIKRIPFAEAIASGRVKFEQDEMDRRYQAAVLAVGSQQKTNHDLRILYSPLHGVGQTSVLPILKADGFTNIEVFQPHATPDGEFPNVPGHVANPENPAVFDELIEHAKASGAELILASDPDADRIGCAARTKAEGRSIQRLSIGGGGEADHVWSTLSGYQIGELLSELLLRQLQQSGRLTPEHYVIKTLVTSDMICRIAEGFGVRAYGDVLTGFKWIGSKIDEVGPEKFVFGFEEAHGYLAGTYARDKDGAVAAMLLAELAAECKAAGLTLHEQLDRLFLRYGCHLERTVSHTMPGADGLAKMKAVMQRLRSDQPRTLGGMPLKNLRDYLQPQGDVPKSDLLIFNLDPAGNRAAVRPSGTEPKLKFYLFAYDPPEQSADLPATKQRLTKRLAALESDLLRAANSAK